MAYGTLYNSTCTHYSAKKVMRVGKKCSLWGGGRIELREKVIRWNLIISAVGYSDFLVNPVKANAEAVALLPQSVFEWSAPPCVGIEWPDRGVPKLDREWWEEMVLAVRKIDGDVGVCCQGGHGRTGTMLAIIATLSGKVKKKQCPVEWVRGRYCHDAVESDDQIEYIEYVTGHAVTALSSDNFRIKALPATPAPEKGGGSPTVDPTKLASLSAADEAAKVGNAISTGYKDGETSVARLDDGTAQGTLLDARGRAILDHEPTDLELLRAMEDGDGSVTELIEGCGGRRWMPVYGEDEDEIIVGWCEEDTE